MEDTKYDESIWMRVPGERGTKRFSSGNFYVHPGSTSTVKEIQKKFREIAVDLQNDKRQGGVAFSGRF